MLTSSDWQMLLDCPRWIALSYTTRRLRATTSEGLAKCLAMMPQPESYAVICYALDTSGISCACITFPAPPESPLLLLTGRLMRLSLDEEAALQAHLALLDVDATVRPVGQGSHFAVKRRTAMYDRAMRHLARHDRPPVGTVADYQWLARLAATERQAP